MTKLDAIRISKEFRQELDAILQRMKEHKKELMGLTQSKITFGDHEKQRTEWELQPGDPTEYFSELIAQHTLSIRDLESSVMRQGMTLKAIGNPTPYPNSYDPKSPVVDPTAEGLKL